MRDEPDSTVVSLPPVPAEAFERYPDRWVALRAGAVIADAATLAELDTRPDTNPYDVVYHVPPTGTRFYYTLRDLPVSPWQIHERRRTPRQVCRSVRRRAHLHSRQHARRFSLELYFGSCG